MADHDYMTVDAYVHAEKGYLWEQGKIDSSNEDEFSDEALDQLRYFLYETKLTCSIDKLTGKYKITHVDGNPVAHG